MQRVVQRASVVAGFVVLAAVLYVGMFLEPPTQPSIHTEQETYWKARITTLGASAAYEEMIAYTGLLPEGHVEGHYFAAALYTHMGVDGIKVCDERLSSACMHEIMGRALSEHGTDILPTLYVRCAWSDPSDIAACRHGIGHGVAAWFGYATEDLRKALDVCKSLGDTTIGSCYFGALMEHNLRTMAAAVDPRPINMVNQTSLCNELDPAYKEACMFSLPQWWSYAMFRSAPTISMYSHIGDLCRSVDAARNERLACFKGAGWLNAVEALEKPEFAKELCAVAASVPEEEVVCRAFSAYSVYVQVGGEYAARVCEGLTSDAYEYCHAYARGEYNFIHSGPVPEL